MNEKVDTGASELRERYWEKFGKPPDGPGPHPERGGPAYIPWLEALVAQLKEDNVRLREYYEAHMAIEQGLADFELHNDAVVRLEKARDALKENEQQSSDWRRGKE